MLKYLRHISKYLRDIFTEVLFNNRAFQTSDRKTTINIITKTTVNFQYTQNNGQEYCYRICTNNSSFNRF